MGSTAQFKEFGPFYYNGQLVQSPRIYHYGAGTTVLLNAYSDRAKTTASAQPLVGNSAGLVKAYFDGVYKFEIRLSDNATVVDTWDNVDLTEAPHVIRTSALLEDITVADGALYQSSIIPIVGCSLGDFVMASYTMGSLNGNMVTAEALGTDLVWITIKNDTGSPITFPAGSWNFLIFKA